MINELVKFVEHAAIKAGIICDEKTVKIIPQDTRNGILSFQIISLGDKRFNLPIGYLLPDPKIYKIFYTEKMQDYYSQLGKLAEFLESKIYNPEPIVI